jgi:hypothetical protein
MGHPWGIGIILEALGNLLVEQGQLAPAFGTFSELGEAAHQLGDLVLQANALYGLARVAAARHEFASARRQGQESQSLFDSLQDQRASEVAQWLAKLPIVP